MSFFRPVNSRLWGDMKFRSLTKATANAQTLWLYLLTGPHNRGLPGLFNLGPGEIGEILDWQNGDVVTTFRELSERARPMALADWPARVVFLPQVFEYEPPAAGNNIKGWRRPFDAIPETDLKENWIIALDEHCSGRGGEFPKAFSIIFGAGEPPPGPRSAPRSAPPPEQDIDIDKDNNNIKKAARAAAWLAELMLENDPKAKIPMKGSKAWVSWVGEIEKLNRLDDRSWEDIGRVIKWSQEDSFWKGNIRSGGKLRKQFPTMALQMQRGGRRGSRNKQEMDDLLGG